MDTYAKVIPNYSCIEVNIKKQQLRLFDGENVILSSPCVTGTKGKNDTPCGTFHIYLIINDVYLLKKYYNNERHINHGFFFLPRNEGIGIHDALWREKEDGFKPDAYLTGGSLGCVQVPLEVSEKLFEKVYLGMPVIVNAE